MKYYTTRIYMTRKKLPKIYKRDELKLTFGLLKNIIL